MEYRAFGSSGLSSSALGFGTWELGGRYGEIDVDEAIQAIYRGRDLGVTLFDTAPAYGNGRSEELLGKALAGSRQDAIIVTKAGIGWTSEGEWVFDGGKEAILKGLEESLARLQTDYVDLLVVHRPDVNAPLDEVGEALQQARRSGMARHVGVSNFVADQVAECLSAGTLAADQIGYNLFDRRLEGTIDYCLQKGIGVMAYGSLCFGLLTGTMTVDSFAGSGKDWRQHRTPFGQALFKEGNLETNLAIVDELKEIAASYGKSLPQLAVNWVLSNPGITVALTGCRKPSEIEDNVGAVGWTLSETDKARVESIMEGAAGTSDQSWP